MFDLFQIASIIFLDSPVGTGFSYAKNPGGYYTDDITSSRRVYQFLSKVRKVSSMNVFCVQVEPLITEELLPSCLYAKIISCTNTSTF